MTAYLLAHAKISLLLFCVLIPVVRFFRIDNRVRLAILYALLTKSLIPWGFFPVIPPFFVMQKEHIVKSTVFGVEEIIGSPRSGVLVQIFSLDMIILLVWASLALLAIAMLVRSMLRLKTALSNSPFLTDMAITDLVSSLRKSIGIDKMVRVKICDAVESPIIWKSAEWIIVLPSSFVHCETAKMKNILSHELVHINRKDFQKFVILRVIAAIFFFSPFVRIVINEIINCEEIETDSGAIRAFRLSPLSFGETIIGFMRTGAPRKLPAPALTKFSKWRLKMRIENLSNRRKTRRGDLIQKFLLVVTTAVVMSSFAAISGAPQKSDRRAMGNPLSVGKLTLAYGLTKHPITKLNYDHRGVDLAAPLGSAVLAPADARALEVGFNDKMGNYIILIHDGNITTLYAHLQKVLIKESERVKKGDRIAFVGTSGISTGPHLHFEVRKNDANTDPGEFIDLSQY